MRPRALPLSLWLLAAACLQATPFDVDVHVRDRTRTNLEALARRTPPRPFKIAVLGDIHEDYDELARTVDAINARGDIELVVVAGDMSDLGLRQELDWVRGVLDGLRVPYLTAIGNHDALSSGAEVYRRMFGPLDYRTRFGGIELVFFNSNALEFPGAKVPDFAWLDAQLGAAADAEGIVLVTHHAPAFPPQKGEGPYDPAAYERLFATHAISLVVHGHQRDWGLRFDHGAVSLQCGTFALGRQFTVVTIDGSRFTFEKCHLDRCEPVAPVRPGAPVL